MPRIYKRHYSDEQLEFIRQNVVGTPLKELTEIYNKHFKMNLSLNQINGIIYRNGLSNGLNFQTKKGERKSPTTEFKKGHIPHNKGKKTWWDPGRSVATRFQKGQTPKNHRPVGSERICVNGYTWVKVKEPRTWKEKHRLIWEAANGAIPEGHCLIFADSDRQNIVLENLLLITRGQLAVMNKRGLITNDAELTKTGVIIADLIIRANDKMTPRQMRKRYKEEAKRQAREKGVIAK